MKHTPGPWTGKEQMNGQGLIYAEESGENIAVSYKGKNAYLIAAAPDLLQALTNIVENYRLTPIDKFCKETPKEAIRKAILAITKVEKGGVIIQ